MSFTLESKIWPFIFGYYIVIFENSFWRISVRIIFKKFTNALSSDGRFFQFKYEK